jgi:enoyl-CoA hydratase/carnithine racemase
MTDTAPSLSEEILLDTIRVIVEAPIATVYLNRPHRHNAWTGKMHADYLSAMRTLEDRTDIRAVIVTGTGAAFCVGGDSDALAKHAESGSYDTGLAAQTMRPGQQMRPEYDSDLTWQYAYRHPIIAAVNGAAAGIGLALALLCDLRFASAPAKITTAAPKLGLPAEYAMSWTLPRLIGVTRANDLLLSGRILTVADTADWGLWNEVLPDGESALERRAGLWTYARHHHRARGGASHQSADLSRSHPTRCRRRTRGIQAPSRSGNGHGGIP